MSATTTGNSAPKMPAPTPSSTWIESTAIGPCSSANSAPRTGRAMKQARNSGLRPHASARRPTRIAIGTITNWAMMMAPAMNALLAPPYSRASFSPASVSIAALAK